MCASDDISNRSYAEIQELFQQGVSLVASTDVPDEPDIRRTASLYRRLDGTVRVYIEHYHPCEWDNNLMEFERFFSDLDNALQWLYSEHKIHWSQLHKVKK